MFYFTIESPVFVKNTRGERVCLPQGRHPLQRITVHFFKLCGQEIPNIEITGKGEIKQG